MQVLASRRVAQTLPQRGDIALALVVGIVLLAASAATAALLFTTGILASVMPSGRVTTGHLLLGGATWTGALAGPALFALVGMARLSAGMEALAARRPRPTPVRRSATAVPDDHVVATGVALPDGARVIPELVVGPFGAAVVIEAPPAAAVLVRGPRSWEVRTADGRRRTIDDPRERAARDAERVRRWFMADDADHVVKVYAAVVTPDPLDRSPICAVVTPEQVPAWLASLPPQRSFDEVRRERVLGLVASAL